MHQTPLNLEMGLVQLIGMEKSISHIWVKRMNG